MIVDARLGYPPGPLWVGLAILGLLVAHVLNEKPYEFEAARRIPLYCFTAGIVWLAHIALDRASGVGLRPGNG